mgnify:CR=1 FL=1
MPTMMRSRNTDAGMRLAIVHRANEVVFSAFPITEQRRESELRGVSFDAPSEEPAVDADEENELDGSANLDRWKRPRRLLSSRMRVLERRVGPPRHARLITPAR